MVETRFQTSFIPKKPVIAGVAYRSPSSGSMGLLAIISLIVVIVVGLISLGLFLYTQFLNSNIARIEEELIVVRDSLDQNALDTFLALGAKTASAQGLLNNHIAFSLVTEFLESVALKNVRFKDFIFETRPGAPANVVIKGEAQSYAALASQVHALKTVDHIRSVSVSGLALDEKGNVGFTIKVELKSDLFAYGRTQGNLSFFGTVR